MTHIGRRISAFLLDMFIVMIVSMMASNVNYLNPYLKQYDKAIKTYEETSKIDFDTKNIESMKNYIKENTDSLYKISHYQVFEYIIYLVFYFLYFVLFQFFNNGQTIGKKIFRLKIVDNNKDKVSFKSLFIKSIFNGNSLGYGVNLIVIINIIVSTTMKSGIAFLLVNSIMLILSKGFEITNLVYLCVNKKNRTPIDYVAKTCVIDA